MGIRIRRSRRILSEHGAKARVIEQARMRAAPGPVKPGAPSEVGIGKSPQQTFPTLVTAAAVFLTVAGLGLVLSITGHALPSAGERDGIILDFGDEAPVQSHLVYRANLNLDEPVDAIEVWVTVTSEADVRAALSFEGPAARLLEECWTFDKQSQRRELSIIEDPGRGIRFWLSNQGTRGIEVGIQADIGAAFACRLAAEYGFTSELGHRYAYMPSIYTIPATGTCVSNQLLRYTERIVGLAVARDPSNGCDNKLSAGGTNLPDADLAPDEFKDVAVPFEQSTREQLALWGGLLVGFGLALLGPAITWGQDRLARRESGGRAARQTPATKTPEISR